MVRRVPCGPKPVQMVLGNPVCNEGKDGGSTVSLDPVSRFISMGYWNQAAHPALTPAPALAPRATPAAGRFVPPGGPAAAGITGL